MTFRRRTAALAVGLSLIGVPTVSAAAPGTTAAADLPPAAFVRDLGPLTATSVGRGPASAPPADARSSAAPTRLPSAVGSSLYVDDCRGTTGDAVDLRRTSMAMSADRTTVQFTLRGCLDGPSLDAASGQEILWRVAATSPSGAPKVVSARASASGWVVRVDGQTVAGATAGVAQPAPGVHELIVDVPAGALDLPPGCNPATAVGCVRLEVASFPSGGGAPADLLPDTGAPVPVWPSSCRPDIDPAAAGHVRLTTTSPATARTVAEALTAAGYRAAAYDDAPHVDVPVGASAAVREALAARDDVLAVEPVVGRRTSAVIPDDPRFDDQWYLRRIGMPQAWETRTGSGLGIAIVDNGVASDHPDLAGRIARGYDAMTDQPLPAGTHSDLGGHGTAVAGLAAAQGRNGTAIAGVDWTARIHPVRVFDHEGCFVSEPAYLDALAWIAREAGAGRVRVANFSLGGSAIPGEAELVTRIVANGAVVVAAVGNNGDRVGTAPSYPAALPEVVAVGATRRDDGLASYSNRGRHVDLVAPGGDQSGTAAGDLLTLADPVVVGPSSPLAPLAGTSFSAPLVTGVAALYLAAHREATPADVTRALVTTADDLGDGLAGYDVAFGFGMVDAARVLDHQPGQTLVRSSGPDRYATAAAASRRAFPDPSLVDVVLLATGENYPDALAGGPLAAREHAPMLLTSRTRLEPATAAELTRLDPQRVVLLGGEAAVSDGVAAQLAARGLQVDRAAGANRYATAATIALGRPGSTWRAWNASGVVYLATGDNFPDALAGGAAAAMYDAPLLLTTRSLLPPETRDALQALRPSHVIVLGGPTAVDDAVLGQVQSLGIVAHRAAGRTRYETAIAALCPTAQLCRVDTRYAVVTTGTGFADALGGSAVAAALRAPLVLVPPAGPVPEVVADALEVVAPEQVVVLGGTAAVPATVADRLRRLAVR